MLKKIISVKNVGRLVNCVQTGPELSRYNLFFAENGRGKTTLCAVLRSLQTGRYEYITERKTIGPVARGPEVELRLDNGNARYAKQTWSMTAPEITIFDASFVAQNVHAGEHVSRDQRANLLEIIVGQTGVALARKVNALDDAIRDQIVKVNTAKKVLEQHLPKGTKLDAFLALPEDLDIDTKIEAKTAELTAAQRASEIKSRSTLTEITMPRTAPNLLDTLSKTLADVSADAEKRLKEQITRHEMHARGEVWLSEGLGYIRDELCPFCGQSTKGLVLVDAYRQFFSQSYNALRDEIQQLRENTEAALGSTALATLGRTATVNEAGIEFWKQFIPVTISSLDYDNAVAAPLAELREATIVLIARKLANPLEPVAPDETFNAGLAKQESARKLLDTYNTEIKTANGAISALKQQTQAADVSALEKSLLALRLTKLRHDPKVKALCADYQKENAAKDKLDEDKDVAKNSLDQHADKMIQNYEASINKLLRGFRAGFSITNSKKTYVGGTPTSTYQILINDHTVDLGDAKTPLGQPSFRTTLSAGDKSTLALAFFLAQLDHDPEKGKRIVIFDDPFNSQDRSRRERTAELLKKCGEECHQLFLLSHDPFFLDLVFSKLPKTERRTLQLSRTPGNNTTIQEWDVAKETQDGYFREHAALSSYLLNGSKELIDIVRKIRPVLEGYLRFRFPNQFPDDEWLGDMIARIRAAGASHPMFQSLEELEGINDYSKKYHHDTNPGKADTEPLDDGELQGYVDRALRIAGGY